MVGLQRGAGLVVTSSVVVVLGGRIVVEAFTVRSTPLIDTPSVVEEKELLVGHMQMLPIIDRLHQPVKNPISDNSNI